MLSLSGAILAIVIGIICAAAGWQWATLLLTFFVTANLLSMYRRNLRASRIDDIVEKGNTRDMWQVAANGGVFTLAALGSLIHPNPAWMVAGAGAIAAVTADTWSTEIGTVSSRPPRLITTRAVVVPGTSGGVTLPGTIAAIAGSALISAIVLVGNRDGRIALASFVGGVAGSLIDSVIGATLQRTRWCNHCEKATERLVHSCGTMTEPRSGVSWIGNDAVNAIASIAGALTAVAVA
jgi:uncharacterized protein (TIGR00297 family)